MEAATLDAILTILALVGVAVLLRVAERALGRPSRISSQPGTAGSLVAVEATPEGVAPQLPH